MLLVRIFPNWTTQAQFWARAQLNSMQKSVILPNEKHWMKLTICNVHGYFKAKTQVGEFRFSPHVEISLGLIISQSLQAKFCAWSELEATRYSVNLASDYHEIRESNASNGLITFHDTLENT